METSFHDWLQKIILEKNIDPRVLAKLTKIPKHQIDSFRKGEILPNLFQMTKIAEVLDIRVDEMPAFPAEKSHLPPVKKHDSVIKKLPAKSQLKDDYKTPLQPIIDKTCVLTGGQNPERAHYTGIMQHLFGKGRSKKCNNLFVAEISKEKHFEFDNPKERKSLEASHDFLVAILLTIERKVKNGQIIFK